MGKNEKASRSAPCLLEELGRLWEPGPQGVCDLIELAVDVDPVQLGEDRLDGRCDRLGLLLLHPRQGVAHEVTPAALPGGAHEDLLDRLFEPEVVIR
jgi:hypothetical protein